MPRAARTIVCGGRLDRRRRSSQNCRVLGKKAKIDAIRPVPLFGHFSGRELSEVVSIANELELPAGRELTKQGTTGREFIVLVNGAAEVRRNGRKLTTLREGDFLGEIALVTGKARTATVTTTEPTQVLVIEAKEFQALLRNASAIQAKVLQAVAKRLPQDDLESGRRSRSVRKRLPHGLTSPTGPTGRR
jgi:CRP/FNR family transcriptional regulator, cyclic AMP receptor protein